MTRFMKKLLGLDARKPASRRTQNRFQPHLENLEERVLQAGDVTWALHSVSVGEPQNIAGQTQMNIRQNHLDIVETKSGKRFTASIDFSTMPTEIKGGTTFQITATVRADGAFDIGPGYKYHSQITGKAQNGYSFSNVVISGKVVSPKGEKSYPKGVDSSLRSETVTFTITAPNTGTSFTISESAPGFGRWNTPSVTFYAFRPKSDAPPPPPPPVDTGIQASFNNGVLTIRGTDKADRIIVGQTGDRVYVENVSIAVNGKLQSNIYVGTLSKVEVFAKSGDDVVRLDAGTQHLYVQGWVDGGLGNDTIVGVQRGKNTIFAGADNDTVTGGDYADTMWGDHGLDSLLGMGGNDQIYAGQGADTVEGGRGDDTLYGDQGDDKLFGQDGMDMLWGGEQSDWLDAGSAYEFVDFGRDSSGRSNPVEQDKDFNAQVWALNGATATDIHQGDMGNCALLASLSSLALRGVNLSSRIKYLGNYMYTVDMYTQDGKYAPQTIKFDGVVYPGDPWPSERGEYWVLLYRQAFRQLRGTIDNGMNPTEPLRALTGKPATWHTTKDFKNNDAFNLIERSIQQRKNVVAGTHASGTVDPRLVTKHAYTVVSVTRDRFGNPSSVTLRNPHGMRSANAGNVIVSWVVFKRDFAGFAIN